MSKRRIALRIVLIAASILILTGVALMTWMLATEDERNVIKVELDGKIEPLEFEALRLVPGQECEYDISFKGDRVKEYDLTLKFAEKEEKTLKNFARVKIISGDEVVYDELLCDAFEGDPLTLHVNFKENKNTKLKIVYYLPIEVGNEAKNAEADFELQITASDE